MPKNPIRRAKKDFVHEMEPTDLPIGSRTRRYKVTSIRMHPSAATAWSNAEDSSCFDVILTPWNVLSRYLESLLQLATIREIVGKGSKAEDHLLCGKDKSILQGLPIFSVSFLTALVFIPSERKKDLTPFVKKATSLVQGLHVVDIDVPLHMLLKDEEKMVQAALGREFHISLGRTVPIRVHQIDSVVAMLRQKLQFQKRYLIDFNKWEVFVNDDKTRTFISIENTTGGLAEISKQIQAVNEVYKLHNLPEFYKDPRPHISIAWAVGDISQPLKKVVEGEMKTHINVGGLSMRSMFTCKFSNIVCKVGNKTYNICGSQGQ